MIVRPPRCEENRMLLMLVSENVKGKRVVSVVRYCVEGWKEVSEVIEIRRDGDSIVLEKRVLRVS